MLGHLRCRIIFSPESIQRAVDKKASHTIRNSDGNLIVRYLYWYGVKWHWYYYWLARGFPDDRPAVVLETLFISLPLFFIGRVLF